MPFGRYADQQVLSIVTPPTLDLTPKALTPLRDVYNNDTEGCCVIASGYHVRGVTSGNSGATPLHVTSAQINADYGAIGGFVVGDPSTDNGCDMQTAMNYWVSKGFQDSVKLTAWLSLDPKNEAQLKSALYLFENHFLGIELPDSWITPFPSGDGFTWDADTPDENNGHCIMSAGYTDKGTKIDSWGMFGTLTWEAIAELCSAADGGEIYVLLSPDMIAKGQTKSPDGFDWATLIADFNALGGKVPVPPPAPAPKPVPTPPAPAATTKTFAQVEAILAANWK